jgi:cyanate permease
LRSVLADGPSNARWLKAEYRPLAVARVAANGTGIKSKNFETKQAIEALCSLKAWLITIAMFGSSVPNGILTNFSGPLIKGMGFSELNAALLDCAGRSLQVISLLIAGIIATKFENCRILMVTIGNIVCVLGSCLMAFLPFTQTWPRLVGLWLINVQSVGFTLGLVMISSNMGGYTKRAVTSSMVFVGYCVGNIVGPLCVLPEEKPVYRSAAYAMLAGYAAKTVCHCLLGWYMLREKQVLADLLCRSLPSSVLTVALSSCSRRRDREHGPADVKMAAELGMKNITENHNKDFRYVL